MRRGFTLIESIISLMILAIVLMFVFLAFTAAMDPLRIGSDVVITINHKRGTLVGVGHNGYNFIVSYVDDRGDVKTATVLRSQLKPVGER